MLFQVGGSMDYNKSNHFTKDPLNGNDILHIESTASLNSNETLYFATKQLPNRQKQGFMSAFIAIGILTNTLSLAIFCRRKLRKFSLVWYLIGNSLSNIMYLLSSAMLWFGLELLGLLKHAPIFYFFVWLTHTSASLSTWYIATVTGDNCMRFCWPSLIPNYCTTTRAKEVLMSLLTTASVLYAVSIWSSEPIEAADVERAKWHGTVSQTNHLLTFVDSLMGFLLPCIVMLPAAVRLTCQLAKNTPRRSTDLPTNMILALLTSSLMFLVLLLPGKCFELYLVILALTDPSTVEVSHQYAGLRDGLKQLYFTSFTFNLVIFIGIWRLFRRVLYEMTCLPAADEAETNLENNSIVIEMEHLISVRSSNRRRVAYRTAVVERSKSVTKL